MINLAQTLRNKCSVNLFSNCSGDPKRDTQSNLAGRTHWASDDTLKFFHSRIVGRGVLCDGALFFVISSDALDYLNTRRGFRWHLFDAFGSHVAGPDIENAFKSSDAARKAFWEFFNAFDAEAYYADVLAKRADKLSREAIELKNAARELAI